MCCFNCPGWGMEAVPKLKAFDPTTLIEIAVYRIYTVYSIQLVPVCVGLIVQDGVWRLCQSYFCPFPAFSPNPKGFALWGLSSSLHSKTHKDYSIREPGHFPVRLGVCEKGRDFRGEGRVTPIIFSWGCAVGTPRTLTYTRPC